MRRLKYILLITISFILCACAYSPDKAIYKKDFKKYQEDAEKHILRVNRHGYLINSDFATYPLLTRRSQIPKPKIEANKQIDHMLISAIKLACRKSKRECDEINSLENISPDTIKKINELKVLVYVHGGLNTYSNTDERMEKQLDCITNERMEKQVGCITNDGNDWHYPIYISWPSNVFGTVQEHFFEVREGRDTAAWSGLVSSPFVLFEDVFTAIGRAPANVYYQFTNDKDRFASRWGNWALSNVWKEADYQYKQQFFTENPTSFQSNDPYAHQYKNIKINRSTYQNNGFVNRVKSSALALVTPIRYAAGIVWNGTLAGDSWAMMKRRARAIAYPTGEVNSTVREIKSKDNEVVEGQSAGHLLERIFNLEKEYPELKIKLTLVGHSMGAIVLNNLLTRYQADFERSTSLHSIVYMAAAANTFETLSIVPDILRKNVRDIHFYNLTLNRVAEVAETYFAGLAPSGSLLISIDKYHNAPEHHLLRTFGSEVNVQSSFVAIKQAFSNMDDPVTLKAFDKDQDIPPYKHGHFGELEFWRCSTWQIEQSDIDKNCQ